MPAHTPDALNANTGSEGNGMTQDGNSTINSPARKAAARLAALLDPKAQARARRRGRLETLYVTSAPHAAAELAASEVVENLAASMYGASGKRRALIILGEAGSGKTKILERTLLCRPELQPFINEFGEWERPMIHFDCPKPVANKLLGRKIIEAAGYTLNTARMSEYEIFELAKNILRERGVLLVVIDEAQHILKGNDPKTIQNIADTLKSLMQIEGWPLHLVLAGVPTLASLLEYEKQLRLRSIVVELESLTYPADLERVRAIVVGIIEKHAEMTLEADLLTDEFIHRLIHAGEGGFGTIIQFIRSACEMALRGETETVGRRHFAEAFALLSGSNDERNIFIAADWKSLTPATTVAAMAERQMRAENNLEARRRNRKSGDK